MTAYDAAMKVADYYCDFFRERGHEAVFGVPGGYVNPLWQAFTERGPIPVLCRHESGACFMADGWARARELPGVVLTTIGPGLTNALTGIASAYYDSVPMIIVSGHSSVEEAARGGFQDRLPPDRGFDPAVLLAPITKRTFIASDGNEAIQALEQAYALSMEGRRGPVHIALRLNAQVEEADVGNPLLESHGAHPRWEEAKEGLSALSGRLCASSRPLLLIGGGCLSDAAHVALLRLVARSGIPLISSIKGVPCCSAEFASYWGVASPSVISPELRQRLIDYESDCVIALGSSLSSASFDLQAVTVGKPVAAHVDVDPVQFDRYWQSELHVLHSSAVALEWLAEQPLTRLSFPPCPVRRPEVGDYFFAQVVSVLDDLAPAGSIVVADAGNHYLDTLYWYRPRGYYSLFANAGLGSMGYAIGASVGLRMGFADRPVICVTGDASFLMYGGELSTAVNCHLDMLFVVSNNYGMGRMRCAYAANGANTESADIRGVSVADIARGLGCYAYQVDDTDALARVLREAMNRRGVGVVEVMVHDQDIPRALRR